MTESTGTQAIDDAPAVTQAQQSAGATDAAPAVGNATPAAQDSLDATADAAEPGARAADEARDDLVAEGDAAGDYLERLLDILDYDGDIDLDVEGERAVVSVIGTGDVNKLVGDHGEVLDALQELTRLAAGMETGQRSRLMLDIAGFRAKRRAELTELGLQTAQQVVSSGEPVKLGAMNPFERKIVHDAVATVDGATSSSEGEEPRRRVVVSLAG
jgi:spoIIIJ-associated protein